MEIAEFLLARITEDEAALEVARRMGVPTLLGGTSRIWSGIGNHPTVSEARLAAECEAKRRIVERLTRAADLAWSGSYAVRDDARDNLADLALPYADHPDFDPSWAPLAAHAR